MSKKIITPIVLLILACFVTPSWANDSEYAEAVKVFKAAGESSAFFKKSYAYALFPSIGKGGFGIGGAFGNGRVYKQGVYIGDTSMSQVTIGFQLGGQSFMQVIFFEDSKALQDFTSGNFEFGAQASAVAINAGVQASAGSTGTTSSTGSSKDIAKTSGSGYNKGMAIFTVTNGGLMYEASVGGQKFEYNAK